MPRPLALAMALFLAAAAAAAAEGRFEAALVTMRAVTPAAAPAPQGDGFCAGRFSGWLETRVAAMWKTTGDGRRIAAVQIRDIATDMTVATGPNSWMGFPKAIGLEEADRILLTIDDDGAGGTVEVLLAGDGEYNCVVSNR